VARAVLERIVELDPSDNDARWKLAYAHGEHSARDLSLLHYGRIPDQERTSATWNNLGVAFDAFALATKAVNAFRKSEEMGEPLAMTNLAGKLITAGFLPEARTECDEAMKIEPPNNLSNVLARLTDVQEDEDKRERAVLEKAERESEFFASFGRANR
jgi:tetratricopeptide (TPR) repeat protein